MSIKTKLRRIFIDSHSYVTTGGSLSAQFIKDSFGDIEGDTCLGETGRYCGDGTLDRVILKGDEVHIYAKCTSSFGHWVPIKAVNGVVTLPIQANKAGEDYIYISLTPKGKD